MAMLRESYSEDFDASREAEGDGKADFVEEYLFSGFEDILFDGKSIDKQLRLLQDHDINALYREIQDEARGTESRPIDGTSLSPPGRIAAVGDADTSAVSASVSATASPMAAAAPTAKPAAALAGQLLDSPKEPNISKNFSTDSQDYEDEDFHLESIGSEDQFQYHEKSRENQGDLNSLQQLFSPAKEEGERPKKLKKKRKKKKAKKKVVSVEESVLPAIAAKKRVGGVAEPQPLSDRALPRQHPQYQHPHPHQHQHQQQQHHHHHYHQQQQQQQQSSQSSQSAANRAHLKPMPNNQSHVINMLKQGNYLLERQLAVALRRLVEANKEKSYLQQRLDSSNIEMEFQRLKNIIASQDQEIKELNNEIRSLKLVNTYQSKSLMEHERHREQETSSSIYATMENQVKVLSDRIKRLSTQLMHYRGQEKSLLESNESLTQQNAKLKSRLSTLERDMSQVQSAKSSHPIQIMTIDETDQSIVQQEIVPSLDSPETQQVIARLQRSLKIQRKGYQAEITSLKLQLAQSHKEQTRLEEELENAQRESRAQVLLVKQLRVAYEELIESNRKLDQETRQIASDLKPFEPQPPVAGRPPPPRRFKSYSRPSSQSSRPVSKPSPFDLGEISQIASDELKSEIVNVSDINNSHLNLTFITSEMEKDSFVSN